MSYYREHMRRLLSQRTGDWLLQTKHPRLVAGSAIAVSMMTFAVYASFLKMSGVQSLGLAFMLAGCLSYTAFLLILALWIQNTNSIDWSALRPSSTKGTTKRPGQTEFDQYLDHHVDAAFHKVARDADGVLEFAAMTAVFGILFISIHYIYHAPYFLGQLLFDSGKISHRAAPKARFSAIIIEPLRQSWLVCAILVLNYGGVGLLLDTIV